MSWINLLQPEKSEHSSLADDPTWGNLGGGGGGGSCYKIIGRHFIYLYLPYEQVRLESSKDC